MVNEYPNTLQVGQLKVCMYLQTFPEVPTRMELQLPTQQSVHEHSLLVIPFPSWFHFLSVPLQVLPGIASQVNYLHSNPNLVLCFSGKPKLKHPPILSHPKQSMDKNCWRVFFVPNLVPATMGLLSH